MISSAMVAAIGTGDEIRLLLVVAFEADPIAGPDDGFKKRPGLLRREHFATGVGISRFDAGGSLRCCCHSAISVPANRPAGGGRIR